MIIINAKNVNEALAKGVDLMNLMGYEVPSRAGKTLEIPYPVTTVYNRPWERVLLNKKRDANPFFHIMEAMWILAGRADVAFLTEFNKRMVDFSDDGVTFNAPYGYRLRAGYFKDSGNCDVDQIEEIINILSKDPNSRQAVAQIWDTCDIDKDTKDKACNMSIVFRIRHNRLDITVYNRSNDMIWGAYGANAVQFSMLQEYVAAKLGVGIGKYYQVSNSFHVYTEGPGGQVWNRLFDYQEKHIYENVYMKLTRMKHEDMESIDRDLSMLFEAYDEEGLEFTADLEFESEYFQKLITPVMKTWVTYKSGDKKKALEECCNIIGDDWQLACRWWIEKRS